ncbi:hypothetical protein PVAP13_5KG535307 [Panicum virgatum]|uniref:Uncharacterized protein n=1 Tax=Panicum virgatum TaxID=38727 RepID=A0A8T0SY24_PANVG|nr:hypothetical protein PVAP13_5KG535307 [Panicum virgatum]
MKIPSTKRRGPSRTPTPVLLPLPVGAAAPTQGQQQQHAPERAGRSRRPRTPPATDGGRARPLPPAGASRRNAGGAAFNGFRGGGKHDLL